MNARERSEKIIDKWFNSPNVVGRHQAAKELEIVIQEAINEENEECSRIAEGVSFQIAGEIRARHKR